MSSVVKGKRGTPKLDAQVKSKAVVNQILIITANDNIFIPKYKSLTDRIIDTAIAIYVDCYEANNIYVGERCPTRAERFSERIAIQEDAIIKSKSLDSLMALAYELFHLRGNKVEYVHNLNMAARDAIKSWQNSDKARQKSIK